MKPGGHDHANSESGVRHSTGHGNAAAPLGLSAGSRHREPVDVHLILRRSDGVLLSRRAGDTYASGLLHMPSGHLDGDFEDVVTGVVREAEEELGIIIRPADVRVALVMQHRSPQGHNRTGWFFEVTRWIGVPRIAEPDRCSQLDWFSLRDLPDDMVAYCRAGLEAYRDGHTFALHLQEPDDSIAYAPNGPNRLTPLPPRAQNPRAVLGEQLGTFAEQTIGPLMEVTDASWAREASRVWRLTGRDGGSWFLKVHQGPKFHQREVGALREWAPVLGAGRAPQLVAADPEQLAVIVSALPGRILHGTDLSMDAWQSVYRQLGQLLRALHLGEPPMMAQALGGLAKLERHLAAADGLLEPGEETLVRSLALQLPQVPPVPHGRRHGDVQKRNLLLDDHGNLALIDWERAEIGPLVSDFVRIADTWTDAPELKAALFDGYGRTLSQDEVQALKGLSALDAVSGIQYGAAHGDPELVERGQRTLHRLRKEAA
ncbi:phosphotransferase [Streptomyces sp. GbtcB6]|uniref:phosphotransferase n=1 Tax=Streptomyces sp. GbtcB6 TaxID=2824751 RepID=UPI001C30F117|nr:phosphotransferase [Streptomyces sp. GbtcB6]